MSLQRETGASTQEPTKPCAACDQEGLWLVWGGVFLCSECLRAYSDDETSPMAIYGDLAKQDDCVPQMQKLTRMWVEERKRKARAA